VLGWQGVVLAQHALDAVDALAQRVPLGPVREPAVVVARRVEQVAAALRVEVEENARHHNHLFLETLIEEAQPVLDPLRKVAQIQPDVEGRVGDLPELEAHALQALDHVVALVADAAAAPSSRP